MQADWRTAFPEEPWPVSAPAPAPRVPERLLDALARRGARILGAFTTAPGELGAVLGRDLDERPVATLEAPEARTFGPSITLEASPQGPLVIEIDFGRLPHSDPDVAARLGGSPVTAFVTRGAEREVVAEASIGEPVGKTRTPLAAGPPLLAETTLGVVLTATTPSA